VRVFRDDYSTRQYATPLKFNLKCKEDCVAGYLALENAIKMVDVLLARERLRQADDLIADAHWE
jgi:hypothetical protein